MRIALALSLTLPACAVGYDEQAQQVQRLRSENQALRVELHHAGALDGTRPVDRRAFAELALERAQQGGRWLAGAMKEDGSFHYRYYPVPDSFELQDYDDIDHAISTYSLFNLHGATKDVQQLEVAERAIGFIEGHSVDVPGVGRAYTSTGTSTLGGQASAISALTERRRVTGDQAFDGLLNQLASFLISMELQDRTGRYNMSYDVRSGQRSVEPPSDSYPGQALLALTRLAQQFPDRGYLESAERLARYLVYERDGDLPNTGGFPRDGHWLPIALPELYRLTRHEDFRKVVNLQAEEILANQFRPDQPYPQRIGAPVKTTPINYVNSATKAEVLVAAWSMARFAQDAAAEERFSEGAIKNCQFQMRAQYSLGNTELFPRPDRLAGAWGRDAVRSNVQIDQVAHNISALAGAWEMLQQG